MENETKVNRPADRQFVILLVVTLIASMLPEIIWREWAGLVPASLPFFRLAGLLLAGILSHALKHSKTVKYIAVLGVIVLAEILTKLVYPSSFWQEAFDNTTFVGNFGGSILLKLIGVLPVVGILLVLFKSPKAVYLVKGDLSIKADGMKWLGIKQDTINWGKLAVISAVLISLGTILLTVVTVTGSSAIYHASNLVKYFPFVILFALINSLCEGIVFRNAVLGSLRNVLPKNQAIRMAALIFGIGHFYGAPRGIVGVVMSTLLGWYLSRSMVETKGFAASWIIHFLQDVVIFSTILLLGNYQ